LIIESIRSFIRRRSAFHSACTSNGAQHVQCIPSGPGYTLYLFSEKDAPAILVRDKGIRLFISFKSGCRYNLKKQPTVDCGGAPRFALLSRVTRLAPYGCIF